VGWVGRAATDVAFFFGGGKERVVNEASGGIEYVIAFLLVLVRVFLFVIVIWFVIREVRKSGRTAKRDDEVKRH